VIYQNVAVPAGILAQVDDATMAAELSWQQKNVGTDNDPSGAVLAFLDGSGSAIGAGFESELLSWSTTDWHARFHYADVPPGTRSIRVKLQAERLTGSAFDAYFDAVHSCG
jgi:hypothetical protein